MPSVIRVIDDFFLTPPFGGGGTVGEDDFDFPFPTPLLLFNIFCVFKRLFNVRFSLLGPVSRAS